MADNNIYVGMEGKVGLVSLYDGAPNQVRLDRSGALAVVNAHGHFQEPAARGKMFTASTAVAGVAPGTALSTTPPACLYNPIGSGVDLAISKTSLGYISGTLGAGSILYARGQQLTDPTGGSELTPVNNRLSYSRGVGRFYQGSTLTAAPTIIRAAFILGAALATTAFQNTLITDYTEGEFIVPSGYVFCIQGVAAAGTSPLVLFGITWEEIPAGL